MLEEAIRTAIEDETLRRDDLEFTVAARVRQFHQICVIPLAFYSLPLL